MFAHIEITAVEVYLIYWAKWVNASQDHWSWKRAFWSQIAPHRREISQFLPQKIGWIITISTKEPNSWEEKTWLEGRILTKLTAGTVKNARGRVF